jgi:hypothetical protein
MLEDQGFCDDGARAARTQNLHHGDEQIRSRVPQTVPHLKFNRKASATVLAGAKRYEFAPTGMRNPDSAREGRGAHPVACSAGGILARLLASKPRRSCKVDARMVLI